MFKFPENLYHSYVIEGDPKVLVSKLHEYLKEKEIIKSQIDVLLQEYNAFSMNDSIFIKKWHSESKIGDGKKVCIIGTKFVNREAENALLKIFEEPKKDTHFFLILPNASDLLPTTLSRVQVIKVEGSVEDGSNFVNLNTKERLNYVVKLIKNYKDDNAELRHQAINLINSLEIVLNKDVKKNKFALKEINTCRKYLSLPGSSVKMILDHLALVV
ncbi:MAG: hypothetical protein U9R00_00665 [Patescibacteria group bacterium]|nr:hypothetical protein [Patescibacteria group bacterium]